MDTVYVYNGERYTWNNEKNVRNIEKHGLSFYEAVKVFSDEYVIDAYDYKHSTIEEERTINIGLINDFYITTVIATDISDHQKRIISAREANKEEKELYNEQFRYR